MDQRAILFQANWQIDLSVDVSEFDEEVLRSTAREISSDPLRWAAKVDDETLNEIEIGGSRLGGVPDLPADFEWPRWQGYVVPLLAQLNLAEVEDAKGLLPTRGWLYVFGLRGVSITSVPFVVFHLDCPVGELRRCVRPPDDDIWVSDTLEEGELPLNQTTPLATASSAMLQADKDVVAWLLATDVGGYGDPNKVAADEGLDGDNWRILFSMKTKYHAPESRSYESAGFGSDAEFHLLIRDDELRKHRFTDLHPFLIV